MKDEIHRLLIRLERLQYAKEINAPHDMIVVISHSIMNIVAKLNADDLLMTHKMWAKYIELMDKTKEDIDNLTEEEFKAKWIDERIISWRS